MNLFAIGLSIGRHKWATIVVVIPTLIIMAYFVAFKPATYASHASVLLELQNAPQAEQVPTSKNARTSNNPLASLQNLVQVADVVAQMVSSPADAQKVLAAGASPGYTINSDASLEDPPVLDITGTGATAQAAEQSAQAVADDIQQDLHQLQATQHVNEQYMITSIEVVMPTAATSSASSKVRSTVVVLAMGIIGLFVAISISQSIEEKRRDRQSRRGPSTSHEEFEPQLPSVTNGKYGSDNLNGRGYDASYRPIPSGDSRLASQAHITSTQRSQPDHRWGRDHNE